MSGVDTVEKLNTLILFCANGDGEAMRFLADVARCARLADDLADGDSLNTDRDAGDLLARLMALVGFNRFYGDHAARLSPIMVHAVLLWEASNEWAASPHLETRMRAFVDRDAMAGIYVTVAMITGGLDHARAALRMMHEAMRGFGTETYAEWESELWDT